MQQHIGKLLPSDGYKVQGNNQLTTLHIQSLFQLYQPIIGIRPISIYLTLHTQIMYEQLHTHHFLMENMNMSLPDIYDARLKCEAIGLIRTFKYEDLEQTIYTYQLDSPCDPLRFFQDGMLSQLLYHQLSPEKFDRLQHSFTNSKQTEEKKGKNVTANFAEVFQQITGIQGQKLHQSSEPVENSGPSLGNETIDWELINQMLIQRMLPATNILTIKNMKLMEQMTVLYQLTSVELEKAILWALTSENQLDPNEFKAACLDLAQIIPSTTVESNQVNQKEKVVDSNSKKDKKTKQEQFIETMETISPKQLLEDLSHGNQASNQDLKMIADVMDKQGIPPAVMNVLIHYVMLKTDMKLTKSYLEKIASHWARKNVKTAHQAMTLAKSEHNKYQQWGNKKTNYKSFSSGKKEVVPEWFKEQKKGKTKKEQTSKQQVDKPKEDVSAMLRKYKEQKSKDR
ncbi:replication initiation and membrane attachment protein [Natronobacillus azotifigens]|uniref:DnaD domain protein n=1 Tax=Natronobacillus azotifigens TaxID=472978 RepID=A0A9J6RGC0_9BACI|nr:DnaD domain protein [Natronobacillus azotifigens]MCZ0704452.1 DnaD domain protein [Natronobacillus azotifigens]